jgi:hypothetical protein
VLRPTKRAIIDAIVAEATQSAFTGDKRDGTAPAITLQNFHAESYRYGAKALRARLSRLSVVELSGEYENSAAFVAMLEEYKKDSLARLERDDRENATRAFRERQAELGRKHGLQPAILAAARHYRAGGKTAKEAWDAIRECPFRTDDGEIVEIEGRKLPRLKQTMCVILRDGRRPKRAIRFSHWRQKYWAEAAKPG